jgi:hypothetical protein
MFVPLLSQLHTPLYICPLLIALPAGNICASRRHLNSSRSITPRRIRRIRVTWSHLPSSPLYSLLPESLSRCFTTTFLPPPPPRTNSLQKQAKQRLHPNSWKEKRNHQAEIATKTRGPPTRSSPKGLASPITDDQDHVIRPRPLSIAERRLLRSRPRPRRA